MTASQPQSQPVAKDTEQTGQVSAPPSAPHLGIVLRGLRKKLSLSLTQVTRKAGIAKSTLSKWENGHVQPRLQELSLVLTALKVTDSERAILYQRMGRTGQMEPPSPFLVFPEVSAETMSAPVPSEKRDAPKLEVFSSIFPVHGDLLRAMRHRALLSHQETARRIGISQGTLAKWEKGLDWPSTERLQALSFTLGATAEEAAILTIGIPTYFPSRDSIDTLRDIPVRKNLSVENENDLLKIEKEIDALANRAYVRLFDPHDLWFMSLLSRLEPCSLREDRLGDRALYLWARVSHDYLGWLIHSHRTDTEMMIRHFLARVGPRMSHHSHPYLWGWYAWVSLQSVTVPLERLLNASSRFLAGRQNNHYIASGTYRIMRELTQRLNLWTQTPAKSRSGRDNPSDDGIREKILEQLGPMIADVYAYLAAVGGDTEAARQFDVRVAAYQAIIKGVNRGADIAMDRATNHYFQGDGDQALEIMPDISLPVSSAQQGDWETLTRLERLRFRARILLESRATRQREEGYHLLEIFNQEVIQLPPGIIRSHLGPIPVPQRI